jgi:riboflavin kinase/FMN adenylyltransferase
MAAFITARDAVPDMLKGGAVVIGNFDGLHRGHQALVSRAVKSAAARGGPAVALTFDPHPRAWFQRGKPFFALSPQDVKPDLMQAAGLNGMCVETFDADFAGQSAEAFFHDVLVKRFNPHTIVVGHDFRFGKGRSGDEAMLRQMTVDHGIALEIVEPQRDGAGEAATLYSSSVIRARLGDGDCTGAAELLGYRWFLRAEVQHGEKRGRELGYPTANMRPDPACGLGYGVYAVLARIGNDIVPGVANFGIRPQFEIETPLMESYFFEFNCDLYGQTLDVAPVAFLRGEAKFDGLEPLIAQMNRDENGARKALAAISADDPIMRHDMAQSLMAMGASAHGALAGLSMVRS